MDEIQTPPPPPEPIKDLDRENKELKAKIKKLENEIEELKKEVYRMWYYGSKGVSSC